MNGGKLSLEINLDQGEIGAVVRSQLAPAIAGELAKLDVGKMILDKLTTARSGVGLMYFITQAGPVHANLLDELISSAIRQEAKAFIEQKLADSRPAIEESFVEMMRGSEKKLTQSFCSAMFAAVDNADWRFEMDVKVSTPAPESDS